MQISSLIIDGHSHFFSYHHYDHMFVDAVKYHKSRTHPTYIWESTGRTVLSSFLNLHNVNSTYSDMCAVTSNLHSNTIQAGDCSDSRYALCQLRKQLIKFILFLIFFTFMPLFISTACLML